MDFKTLVIGSGGEKGFIYLGVLSVLWKTLSNVDRLCGSSVGSAILFLYSLGYDTEEVKEIAIGLQLVPSWRYLSLKRWGLFSNDHIRMCLEKSSKRKYNVDLTFIDHWRLTGYELVVCVFNVTTGVNEYISYKTHPNMSVSYCVTMSCTIPFVFSLMEYNDCLYGDGAIGDCLPLIDNETCMSIHVRTITTSPFWNIIYGPLNSYRSLKLKTSGYNIEIIDRTPMSREEMYEYGVMIGDKALKELVNEQTCIGVYSGF